MSGRGSVVNTSRQPGGRRPADEKEQGAVLVVAGSAGRWARIPGFARDADRAAAIAKVRVQDTSEPRI